MARRSPQTERLVEMIEFLASVPQREYRLADLARLVDLDDATCYPMLSELTRVGWLVKDRVRKTYRLGPRLIALGAAAQSSLHIATCARPELDRLARETGLTTCLILPSSNDLVIAELARPDGDPVPLQAGDHIEFRPPLGSVLVAWAAEYAVDAWLKREDVFAADPDSGREVLRAIRARGFAVELAPASTSVLGVLSSREFSEAHGSRRAELLTDRRRPALPADLLLGEVDPAARYSPMALSTACFDSIGTPVAAVSALTLTMSMSGDAVLELGAQVADAGARITERLGGAQP